MICGTIIQHAFRGLIFPYRSGIRVVTYDNTADKLTTKFTRTVYFGTFSWFASLLIGTSFNNVLIYCGGPNLTELVVLSLDFSSADAYALLASATLILFTTPILCLVGKYLHDRSGIEYTERMRLRRDNG